MTEPPEVDSKWLQFDEDELGRYWTQLLERQRHEDGLFTTRFSAFLVATTLLLTALAHFREPSYVWIGILLCAVGMIASLMMWDVLHRTGVGLQKNRKDIVEVESLLFEEELRPFHQFMRHPGYIAAREVNRIIGLWFPIVALAFWLFALLLLVRVHQAVLFHDRNSVVLISASLAVLPFSLALLVVGLSAFLFERERPCVRRLGIIARTGGVLLFGACYAALFYSTATR